jgi:hypothetical protein
MAWRTASSCCVWLVSILPLAVPSVVPGAERWLAGISRTGLCALAWFVYLSRPRAASGARRSGRGLGWSSIGLALPPLALAARIDLSAGVDAPAVWIFAALCTLASALLCFAAERSSSDERCARRYAIAWMALVIGAPLVCETLERGGAPAFGALPGWLALVERASPLAWIAHASHSIRASALDESGAVRSLVSSALLPACTCVALILIGARGARREPAP